MTTVQTKAMALSPEYIRTSLQELYGTEFTAPDVRAWCAMNGCNYQTVTKKLEDCKVGRGKWNLEVTKETVKELEVTYNAPAAQNLVPQKDDSFVQFGNFSDIKKLLSPVFSIRRSLRGFRATAKRSLSSKRAPKWVVNLFE